MSLSETLLATPVGTLRLRASPRGLVAILWPTGTTRATAAHPDPTQPHLQQAALELTEYFSGTRQRFTTPLDLRGTPFQLEVWHQLLQIPFGETRSYADLARALGNPAALRAVGAANGRNPVSIIVPCHRVIGASGRLTGFAGGLPAKAHLLDLESRATRLF